MTNRPSDSTPSGSITVDIIDLQYGGVAESTGAYLVRGTGAPALIETGTMATRGALTAGLAAHGVAPGDIQNVLVTHIHLDHAGAAGWLAEAGATIHVHGAGAPHLIDPSRLIRSARRIYGDDLDTLMGEPLPVPDTQVRALGDGDTFDEDGIVLTALDTPGHARHHLAFALDDNGHRSCFVGDAVAMLVPGTSCFAIPAPPPEFDLDAWIKTLDRIAALSFDRFYFTHFGPHDDPGPLPARLAQELRQHVAWVEAWRAADLDADRMLDAYREQLRPLARDRGVDDAMFRDHFSNLLLSMSLGGINRALDRRSEAAEPRSA